MTPSEDLYFLFYFPGLDPPGGFNLSFYSNPRFESAYYDVFSELDQSVRVKQVSTLENMLVADAAAVPLLHRVFSFLSREELDLPIDSFLRRYYVLAKHGDAD